MLLSDQEKWMVPFKNGWWRELRFRQNATSRIGDVYFHTPGPQSVQLRSYKEIEEYLGLHPDQNQIMGRNNFCMKPIPIAYPPVEIVKGSL